MQEKRYLKFAHPAFAVHHLIFRTTVFTRISMLKLTMKNDILIFCCHEAPGKAMEFLPEISHNVIK